MSKNRRKQEKQPYVSGGFNVSPFSQMGLDIADLIKPDPTHQDSEAMHKVNDSDKLNPKNGNINELTIRTEKKGREEKR